MKPGFPCYLKPEPVGFSLFLQHWNKGIQVTTRMSIRIHIAVSPLFLATVFLGARAACAADISGAITTTLTIMDDSRLVDDVTCTVTGAPCIAFGASGLTLDLNGFSMTGLADVQTTCASGPTTFTPPAAED